MKKLAIFLIVALLLATGATAFLLYERVLPHLGQESSGVTKINNREGEFSVFQNGNFIQTFGNWDDAYSFANQYTMTYITKKGQEDWMWDNYPPFSVCFEGEEYLFKTLSEAMAYGRAKPGSYIVNRANKATIWQSGDALPASHKIEGVPLIAQFPELPRGCEVTALAMLLNYYGIGVSKMDLAHEVAKDPTEYSQTKEGVVTFGNPSYGFVGDMYDKSKPGLGVYHEPLMELMRSYIGGDALDLTGSSFTDLFYFIAKDKPVVVITNYTFTPLEPNKFEAWKTPFGDAIITTAMHAVTIIGYDESTVYFNDPFNDTKTGSAPLTQFINAWEQMGHQALTYFE